MMTREDILNLIDEEDIEFIRLQFTDFYGMLKNIAITSAQLRRVSDNKFFFESSAFYDNFMSSSEELYLVPDYNTFVVLPWRPQQGKVGKLFCDVYKEDGSIFELSPRSILKNVVSKAAAKGYSFEVSPENEFFLFHMDENGNPTTITHEKAGYLDVGPIDFGENARRDIVLALEDMGLVVESSHHEMAPAQHAIDLAENSALKSADDLMTFRFAARSIAKRFGLYATFMPMPVQDVSGNGAHLKFRVYKDDKNIFRTDKNAEMSFVAGILAHLKALSSITNPTVNSYKRIMHYSNGIEATVAEYGDDVSIKVKHTSEDAFVNLKFPDGSSNPYLAIAACIAAGLDGIERELKLSDYTGRKKKEFPKNLIEAVNALKADKVITECIGKDFSNIYFELKSLEWEDYVSQVSQWELDTYLSKI